MTGHLKLNNERIWREEIGYKRGCFFFAPVNPEENHLRRERLFHCPEEEVQKNIITVIVPFVGVVIDPVWNWSPEDEKGKHSGGGNREKMKKLLNWTIDAMR